MPILFRNARRQQHVIMRASVNWPCLATLVCVLLNSPAWAFNYGDHVECTLSGMNIRSSTDASSPANILATANYGDLGTVTGGPYAGVGNTYTWYYVSWNTHPAGYSISIDLQLVSAPPSLSSVVPSSYPASGNNQTMTLNGSSFQNGATLTFVPPEGGTIASTASKLTFVSASQISYQFNDASDVGTWSVRVNNPDGQSSGSISFTVTAVVPPPSLSSVVPSSYPASGNNQTMTLNGSSFQNGATLTFVPPEGGTIASTASKLTFVSTSQISYQFNDASDAGTWSVRVNNPDGQSSASVNFSVNAQTALTPSISAVSPAQPFATDGNQNFTIYGSSFDSTAYVNLDDNGGTVHPLSGSRIISQDSTHIIVNPNFTTLGVGMWKAQVVNGSGTPSAWFSFQVVVAPGTQLGVDYADYGNGGSATTGVDVPGIKAAGKQFVGEYIGTADNYGYLRPADVVALTSQGLQIVSIFERTPTSASYFTLANADYDATVAIAAAIKAGQPSGSAIYFTVDFDPGSISASLSAIDGYFQEIRKDFNQYFNAHPGITYDIGVYAPGNVLPTIMSDASVSASYSWVAEPFGYPYSSANLAQVQDSTGANPILIGGIDVDLDVAYTANFGQWGNTQRYTVTPSSGANGNISPNTPQTVPILGSVTFTAAPATAFVVDQWFVNGLAADLGDTSFALPNVSAPTEVQVTFKPAPSVSYTVTPSAGANGSISPSQSVLVASGDSVAFTALPFPGYIVDQWLVNNTPVQTGGTSYALPGVTGDTAVNVTFSAVPAGMYTVTATPVPSYGGAASGGGVYSMTRVQSVSQQTVTATPNSGYSFINWTENGNEVSSSNNYSFTLTTNRTLVANFTATPAIASDMDAPVLQITQPFSSGVFVTTTNSVIMAGTASDLGHGDNGISSVTVNGVEAASDTTANGGMADWSLPVSLGAGTNTITIVATDDSANLNATTQTVQVAWVPATPPALPLNISSLKLQAKFKRVGFDSCAIKGTLAEIPAGFSVANASATLDVGGASSAFQLNAKGSGANGSGSIKFSRNKKTGVWTFTGKLKGDLKGSWVTYGIVSGSGISADVAVPVSLTLRSGTTETFDASAPLFYSNRSGASGIGTYQPVK